MACSTRRAGAEAPVDLADDPEDNEVDFASLAYQIRKNACDADATLKKTILELPNVVFSTKASRCD